MTVRELMALWHNKFLFETRYCDVGALQSVTDFWTYQSIIHERQPDYLIEIGNFAGGSTLAWAHMFDLIGNGQVIAIDLNQDIIHPRVKEHPRITFLEGQAVEKLSEVQALISGAERVMVVDDSSHEYENTLEILRHYSPLVTVGDYFVVEDTICWHGVEDGPQAPNAYEAVEQFLTETTEFVSDRDRESFIVTWNPKGYLLRTS